MKKPLGILVAVLLAAAVAGPAGSQQNVPQKATEGSDIRKQESKTAEDTSVRKKKKKPPTASGQTPKGAEDTEIRKKKKTPVEPSPKKGSEGSDARK